MENWLQTETGGILIANTPAWPQKAGSLGRPMPGIEVAIARLDNSGSFHLIGDTMQQGFLLIKKGWPSMFKAYKNEAHLYEKCFEGDWYISGDLVQRDEEGCYWFMGRAEDRINIGGQLLGASFVEQKWALHPAICEVAVIDISKPGNERILKGFVVLKQGITANEKLEEEIKAFVRKELRVEQEEIQVAFIAELPRTANGYVLRRVLQF
jgi:acetyl-CoA synthetase